VEAKDYSEAVRADRLHAAGIAAVGDRHQMEYPQIATIRLS
jgi:hypothetical protein